MTTEDKPLRARSDEAAPDVPRPGPTPDLAEHERAIGEQAESAMDSNPNASGPRGLEGGMGVSSERTGPAGADPRSANPIEGTGTKGTAMHSTDGGLDTSPAPRTDEDVQGTEGVE